MGTVGFAQRIAQAGSAEAAVAALDLRSRDEALARADAVLAAARLRGIRVTLIDGEGYPATLRELEDPPPVLFTLGDPGLLDRAAVAIVGARDATAYGLRVTATLARGASAAGIPVISGLARGVDAQAHRSALGGSGSTIAVLGTGVDVPYPRENAELFERIEASGLLLSEAPPGSRAHGGSFPRRNRLIAALADVVIVAEAGVKSGSLITAGVAVALHRIHGAVPGPIDTPTSAGSNQMLRDGAQAVTSVQDLVGLVNLTPRGQRRPRRELPHQADVPNSPADLSGEERQLLAMIRMGPRLPDELVAVSGLPPATLAAALATLTVHGLAEVDAGGVVRSC